MSLFPIRDPTSNALPAALIRSFCLALGLAWAVPVDVAAEPFAEPQFHIESLRVEGAVRASEELIVAESLLEAGRDYAEGELQQAVFRIQRLPFVLDATFAIERGTERGSYVLVIRVEEIKRWFFGEDVVFTRFTNSVAFDNPVADDWVLSPGPLAGFRFFFGRYNVAFVSVAGDRGLQAGYTRYNLFDRRVVFSLGLTSGHCCQVRVFSLGLDPTFSSWRNERNSRQFRLALGVPLGQRTSLNFQATISSSEQGERQNLLGADRPRASLVFADQRDDAVDLSLVYDSTDDPLFPSSGLKASAAVDYQVLEADLEVRDFSLFPGRLVRVPPELVTGLPSFDSRQWRVSGTVEQHWPLGRRMSVSLSARLAAGLAEVENLPILEPQSCPPLDFACAPNALRLASEKDIEVFESLFTAQLSADLWGPRRTRERGDLRLETRVEFSYDKTAPDLELADNPLYRKSITASLVFRNVWGLFRFSLQVADLGRGF